jgi:ketopantoate reductase
MCQVRRLQTLPRAAVQFPSSLRVFGCLPVSGARGCTEAGVRKASKEETAGEYAPAAVSVYGDLGVVRQTGTHHGMIFGQLDGRMTPRVERILDICRAAGIDAVLSDNVERARWQKFIGLAAVSGLRALTRRPIGDRREDPDLGPLLDDAMQEVVDVGRSCGVKFASDVLQSVRATMIRPVPPHAMPSMAVDLRAGNRLELPWLAGKVVEPGRGAGRPDARQPRGVCGAQAIHQRPAGLNRLGTRHGRPLRCGLVCAARTAF